MHVGDCVLYNDPVKLEIKYTIYAIDGLKGFGNKFDIIKQKKEKIESKC